MKKYELLFQPIYLGNVKLKNRFVFPAFGSHYANTEGEVTQEIIDHYVRLAQGGVGLIVVEFTAIDRIQRGSTRELVIWDDKFIPGFSRLVEALRPYDVAVALQLHHPGRFSDARITGYQGVAPSPISAMTMREVPHELSRGEIETIINEFVEGARRAKAAGFDAVELHGASGYLIYEFFSPLANVRNDEWGGDLERRMRFTQEIIRRSKERVGKDYPIILRMAVTDFQDGGLTIEHSQKIVQVMEKEGADSISVTAGTYDSPIPAVVPPVQMAPGCHVELSAAIKKVAKTPVMVAGRINTPQLADRILREGKADLICMGRPLIADPDLPKKTLEGREREIQICVADNTCGDSITRGVPGAPLVCLMNPEVGRWGKKEVKAEKIKRVMVIGDSPAGIEAARVAALRGHQLALWHAAPKLGGRWSYMLQAYIPHRLSILKNLGVKVELGKEITPASVRQWNPDLVIVTRGLTPMVPKILGLEKAKVYQANDVLEGKVKVSGKVVIIGGNNIGLECAEFLNRQGTQTVILEERWVGRGFERFIRRGAINRLSEHGVRILANAKIIEVKENQVELRNEAGKQEVIEMDCIVIALPAVIDDILLNSLKEAGLEVLPVDPCQSPRDYVEAATSGAALGRKI